MELGNYHKEVAEIRDTISKKQHEFVMNMVSGLTKRASYRLAWKNKSSSDYYIDAKVNELMAGNTGKYYGLLMSAYNMENVAPFVLKRNERMLLLSNLLVKVYEKFSNEKDTRDLNSFVRMMNELNKMTGEHAAEEINVNSTILTATINQTMSDTEATQIYKDIMQGARIQPAIEKQEAQTIDYKPLITNEKVEKSP